MNSYVVALIYMLILFGGFVIAIFLPDRKRKKQYNDMMKALRVNDDVETIGGVIGKVVNIQEDYVIIQTGPDKIKLKFKKSAIAKKILNRES